jgi:hypothetical protein
MNNNRNRECGKCKEEDRVSEKHGAKVKKNP